jgi:hypothetical protein
VDHGSLLTYARHLLCPLQQFAIKVQRGPAHVDQYA